MASKVKSNVKAFVMGKSESKISKGASKAHHTAKGINAPVRHSAKQNNFGSFKKATGKSFKSVGVC